MAKAKAKRSSKNSELDITYFLKLTLYLIVGAQWIRLANSSGGPQIPIPLGLVVGLLFASQEHFKIDKKIEYAVLLVATLVGFWSQTGIYINA